MASFTWVLRTKAGEDLRTTETFGSKDDAEAWMGTEWSNLRAEGADSVALMEDGALVYEMSLHEA